MDLRINLIQILSWLCSKQTKPLMVCLCLVAVGQVLLVTTNKVVYAGYELASFDIIASNDLIRIEWITMDEREIGGFTLEYKEENQGDGNYRLLTTLLPQGSNNVGATYHFEVQSGLEVGKTYCFRLSDMPLNGDASETQIRCGYGLGINPTPTILPSPTATPTYTMPASNTNVITGGVVPPLSPLPTPTAPESPLPTPIPPPTFTEGIAVDPNIGVAAVAQSTPVVQETPVESSYIVLTATPTAIVSPPAPTFTPMVTATPQPEFTLAGIELPDSQNVMLALLCFVFSSASGIGILGLITTLLYMRSRAADSRPMRQRE